jgi:hypothetical protein
MTVMEAAGMHRSSSATITNHAALDNTDFVLI